MKCLVGGGLLAYYWSKPIIHHINMEYRPMVDKIGVSTYGCGHIIHHAVMPWRNLTALFVTSSLTLPPATTIQKKNVV
jgi:hypothetical protein